MELTAADDSSSSDRPILTRLLPAALLWAQHQQQFQLMRNEGEAHTRCCLCTWLLCCCMLLHSVFISACVVQPDHRPTIMQGGSCLCAWLLRGFWHVHLATFLADQSRCTVACSAATQLPDCNKVILYCTQSHSCAIDQGLIKVLVPDLQA